MNSRICLEFNTLMSSLLNSSSLSGDASTQRLQRFMQASAKLKSKLKQKLFLYLLTPSSLLVRIWEAKEEPATFSCEVSIRNANIKIIKDFIQAKDLEGVLHIYITSGTIDKHLSFKFSKNNLLYNLPYLWILVAILNFSMIWRALHWCHFKCDHEYTPPQPRIDPTFYPLFRVHSLHHHQIRLAIFPCKTNLETCLKSIRVVGQPLANCEPIFQDCQKLLITENNQ